MIPNQRLSLSGAFFTITFLLLANCEQAFANPLDQLATELKNAVNRGIEEGLKKGGVQNGSRHSAPRESTQERQERYQNLRNQATARQNGSGSAQQIVQQTKSENVENEIFSEEELAEIEQYIYDGPSRSKEVDLNTIFHQQKSWNNPLTGYSYVPLMKQAPGFRQLTAIKGFYSITCRYKPGSVSSATIDSATFWYRRRPINSISPSRYWLDGKLQIFDIAIEHCPETVGAMYQMTYGEDVLARATETGEHAKEQRRLYSAMSSEERENYKIEQKRALNPGWNKDSKANPADQDRQLVKDIIATISDFERQGTRLELSVFRSRMADELRPKLEELANSGYAKVQSIPVGANGRARFDKWDNAIGGHVFLSINRILDFARRRGANSEVIDFSQMFSRQSDSDRKIRRAAWREEYDNLRYLLPIRDEYEAIFRKHLEGRPVMDPGYLASLKSKLHASPAASKKWRTSMESTPQTSRNDDPPELMTLDELAAAEFGSSIGKGVGGSIGAIVAIKQANAEFDSYIRNARVAFWRCYEVRCSDGPRLYHEYSKALKDKDAHYLLRPAMDHRLSGTQLAVMREAVLGQLGSLEIDGGNGERSCWKQYRKAQAAAYDYLAVWKVSISSEGKAEFNRLVANYYLGPEYSAWQYCRDRSEYLHRPRPQ